jgi:hypothetical protein
MTPTTTTTTPAPRTVNIFVTREPFVDFFILHIPKPDGSVYTEELDVDETMEWFRSHGGDMVLTEKALDHCYNFARCAIEIEHYKEPPVKYPALEPKID